MNSRRVSSIANGLLPGLARPIVLCLLLFAASCGSDTSAADLVPTSTPPTSDTTEVPASLESEPATIEGSDTTSTTGPKPQAAVDNAASTFAANDEGAVEMPGTLLASNVTEPASWGGVSLSFRKVSAFSEDGEHWIAAEFFAKSALGFDRTYQIAMIALGDQSQPYPWLAKAVADSQGERGVAIDVPTGGLFYGIALFQTPKLITDIGGVYIRIGTPDAVYTDIPLDGSPFNEPDYPVFVDLEGRTSLTYTPQDIGLTDCQTSYTAETTITITAGDPLTFEPAKPGLRFAYVSATVQPTELPDINCPDLNVVAEAIAPTLTSNAGDMRALVSEANPNANVTADESNYVAIWQLPAATSQLRFAPVGQSNSATEFTVDLDLYVPEQTEHKTLAESLNERDS